jgi:hypothetical protein
MDQRPAEDWDDDDDLPPPPGFLRNAWESFCDRVRFQLLSLLQLVALGIFLMLLYGTAALIWWAVASGIKWLSAAT